ncbi:MAG: aminopeptidase [Flavobacteriales bacterium CG_4_8_14_3_um_filter_35_10]|nr:MAG: aminopeptidase [Flavobacteriales bacterium CG_4_8_14_3_um_filter_35_10]
MSLWCASQSNTIKINAQLDETTNIINIQQEILFTNTSTDTLKFMLLNNWPNSFKDRKTILADRLLDDFDRKFRFAKLKQRGYTKIISIQVDYQSINYNYPENNSDILRIPFPKPLAPNQSASIIATYKVKLPDIALTGYGGNYYNYYLKYWYLIPSVYENGKWKAMNNINLDDMYSMPYTYEIDFEAPSRFQLTSNLLVGSSFLKNNKMHYVMHCNDTNDAEIYLQSESLFEKFTTPNVDVYTDIKSENLNPILKAQILSRAVEFIESYLGAFPYPKMVLTKVAYDKNPVYGFNQLPKMLHPFNDTFEWDIKIFKTLSEKFIYRSLLFNHREDAWLADGMQTYLMMQYVEAYYKDVKAIGSLSKLWGLRKFYISKLSFNEKYPFVYQFAARQNLDQALSTQNDSLSNFNRKIVNRYKAGMGLQYLDAYLGDSIVKQSFKSFYKQYKLKKTSSKDFETLIKSKTDKPVDWFFKDFIHTDKKIDYTISKSKVQGDSIAVTIKNNRNITTPVILYGLNDKTIIYKKWFNNIDTTLLVNVSKIAIDKLVLNYENLYPEYNLRNNWKKVENSLFNRPLQFRFLKDVEDPEYNQVFYNVFGNYNFYDGFLLGPRIYNETFLKKNILYRITPTYGFKSQTFTGSFSLLYNYLPENSNIYQYRFGITGSSSHFDNDLLFTKFAPFVSIDFKRKSLRDAGGKSLLLRFVTVNRERNFFSDPTDINNYNILNLRYGFSKPEIIRDLRYYFDLQFDKKFSKLSFDLRYRKLTDLNRQIDLRLFAGTFIYNNTNGDFFSFALNKPTDYLFDYNYIGRSEKTGFLSQQIIINEGAFKSKVSQSFANQWVLAANQSISIWRYLEVYSDLGLVKNQDKKAHFLYDAGVRLNIAHELFEIYFPVYSNNSWEIAQPNYNTKIRFILTTDIGSFIKVVKRGFF